MSSLTRRGVTISDQLARHARHCPDRVAFRLADVDRTYGELDRRATRLANALSERGVAAGDAVAVLTVNSLEAVETFFACARIGAMVVPINFRLVAAEVAYLLADSGAVAVVVDAALAPVVLEARRQCTAVKHCLVVGRHDSAPGTEAFDHVVRAASAGAVERVVDEQNPALIMYTSGTTGKPKGAVLTHHNLLMHTVSFLIHIGAPVDCRSWLISTPLFHIAGIAGILPSVFRGDRVVLTAMGAFDAGQTVDLLEREKINACFFVPAQWQLICELPSIADRDLSALRMMSWGAAPASPALLRKIMATFPGAQLYSAFGQTECSPTTTVLRGEDAVRKLGSVGTPMLNVEVRVVDEHMNDVAIGEVGEIVYRGPTVMKEYWNKPDASRAAFTGGWFHSGDLVRRDDEGYIYVVDRLKDMIISGGENIYSAEVENAIAEHPGVAEVAVIGLPDERWGEVPVAVVVPASPGQPPTADDIGQWCRQRLAAYKCPKHLCVLTALPRNATGKVLKSELRAQTRRQMSDHRPGTLQGTGAE